MSTKQLEESMARRYIFANQKGGVTKSTTTINSAVMSTLCGKRTLVVDMDGQGNTTYAFGYNPDQLDHTVYTVMQGQSTITQALRKTYFDPKSGIFFNPADARTMEALGIGTLDEARRGPDILPNNILAGSADSELQENPTWGILLREILSALDGYYDDMYVDTNPSLGKLTVNALYSGTDVVIPMTPEAWSMQGMMLLAKSVVQAQKANTSLRAAGILFTRVRYATHQEVMQHVREKLLPAINGQYADLKVACFETVLHEGAVYGEAANSRTNIILAAPFSSFALEHWRYYSELLTRTSGSGVQAATTAYQRLLALHQEDAERKQARKQTRSAVAGKED
jgi:chromosome partitioning protein